MDNSSNTNVDEDDIIGITQVSKGRITIPSEIRKAMNLDKTNNLQAIIWAEDEEKNIFAGRLFDSNKEDILKEMIQK